jgi:integrase
MAARKDDRRGWVVDFWVTYPNGRRERIRQTSPVQNKRGAEQFERELRQHLQDPQRPKTKKKEVPTFKAFVDSFVVPYITTNNKPSTRRNNLMVLNRHLLPVFARTRLDQIKMGHIERYKAKKLKQGLAPKTINNQLTVLRKSLALAVEDEIIDRIPKFKWMKTQKPSFDFLDFDEADRLMDAAEGQWQAMIILAARAGLRQSELLGLRWDDVDLVRGQLHVCRGIWRGHVGTPKGGRSRYVPLSPLALKSLKSHRHLKGELVFCEPDGSYLTDGKCKHPLWSACKRAGLRRIGWHVLRHTFASHLAMLGVPLMVVQEYLGHTTIEMTMRYAHLSPEVGRESVARLDQHGLVTIWTQGGVGDHKVLKLK